MARRDDIIRATYVRSGIAIREGDGKTLRLTRGTATVIDPPAHIDFKASLDAQTARTREILERLAVENRVAELLRRLDPPSRTHRSNFLELEAERA